MKQHWLGGQTLTLLRAGKRHQAWPVLSMNYLTCNQFSCQVLDCCHKLRATLLAGWSIQPIPVSMTPCHAQRAFSLKSPLETASRWWAQIITGEPALIHGSKVECPGKMSLQAMYGPQKGKCIKVSTHTHTPKLFDKLASSSSCLGSYPLHAAPPQPWHQEHAGHHHHGPVPVNHYWHNKTHTTMAWWQWPSNGNINQYDNIHVCDSCSAL